MCTKIRLQTAYCLLRGIFSFLCPLVWLFKQIFCKNFKWRLIEVDVSLKIWKLRNITWVNRGGFSIVNRVLRGGLWKIDCKWGGISLVWHNLNPRIPTPLPLPPPPHTGPQVTNNDQCQSMNLHCRSKASTEVAAQIGRPVAWVRHSSISVVLCQLLIAVWIEKFGINISIWATVHLPLP